MLFTKECFVVQHELKSGDDSNLFEGNQMHSVLIFHDENSHKSATQTANELSNIFYTVLGVLMVNM